MNISSLKRYAHKLKRQTLTVYFAAREPDMPTMVKALALFISAYALSPIDLIPDFIPVIGYLDDLIIIPLGLALVIRFTPQHVMQSAQIKADQVADKPVSYITAVCCIVIWLLISVLFIEWIYRVYSS